MNQSLPTTSYYEYLYEISDGVTPTKLMYGWSKWGGGSKGLLQTNDDIWFCQSCRNGFANSTPSFMFPMYTREFGRICQKCLDKAILKRIRSLWDLMKLEKKDHGIF